MAAETRSLVLAAAVFLGAVILVGVPATVFTLALIGEILAVLNVAETLETGSPGSIVAFLIVFLGSLLVGLQIAYEAALLQLVGITALNRGPRWVVLVRHLVVGLGVLGLFSLAILIGILGLFEADRLWLSGVSGLLSLVAVTVLIGAGRVVVMNYRDTAGSASV
jgi:hypothetical protein